MIATVRDIVKEDYKYPFIAKVIENKKEYINVFQFKNYDKGRSFLDVYNFFNPPTWSMLSLDTEVLGTYNTNDYDYIEYNFYSRYRKPNKMYSEGVGENFSLYGFIDPNGVIYSCGHGEHTFLAKEAFIDYYKTLDNSHYSYYELLVRNGWVVINSISMSFDPSENIKPTKEQLETIQDIIYIYKKRQKYMQRFNKHVMINFGDFLNEIWWILKTK